MATAPRLTCYRHPNRETGLSCSECGRPICTDCMTSAPVGIRCPDARGRPQPAPRGQRRRRGAFGVEGTGRAGDEDADRRSTSASTSQARARAAGINAARRQGSLIGSGVLHGPVGRAGRVVAARDVDVPPREHPPPRVQHARPLAGSARRSSGCIGRGRFLRALHRLRPRRLGGRAARDARRRSTVGASGAIFGILGALLVFEWQRRACSAGRRFTIIVINLVFSFTVSGHLRRRPHRRPRSADRARALALSRLGRGHAAVRTARTARGVGALVAIGALSVALAYWAADDI